MVLILSEKDRSCIGKRTCRARNLVCGAILGAILQGQGLPEGKGRVAFTNFRWQVKETEAWQSRGHGPVNCVAGGSTGDAVIVRTLYK